MTTDKPLKQSSRHVHKLDRPHCHCLPTRYPLLHLRINPRNQKPATARPPASSFIRYERRKTPVFPPTLFPLSRYSATPKAASSPPQRRQRSRQPTSPLHLRSQPRQTCNLALRKNHPRLRARSWSSLVISH